MLLAGTAISTGDRVPLTLLWFPAVALAHLDDYENTCKSYEQALTLDRSDLTHVEFNVCWIWHMYIVYVHVSMTVYKCTCYLA